MVLCKDRQYRNYLDAEFEFWHSHIEALHLEEGRDVLIFGCGMWGKALVKELNKHKNVSIKGFCDNNLELQGQCLENYPIYSAEESVDKYPNAFYIVAIDKYADIIEKQLIGLSVNEERVRIFETYNSGKSIRKYFEERLNDNYFMDKNYPAEPVVPVVKNSLIEDKRDFRVYIDEGLANTLDQGIDPLGKNIMDQYEKYYGEYKRIENISTVGEGNTSVKVMIACSHKDRAGLWEENKAYYVPIQVGKALTEVSLYDLCDNTGDNISDRNYNYSECTALYWAWKNQFAFDVDYIGLRHYRRKFDIIDEQLCHLKENGIDIVHLEPIFHDNLRNGFIHFTKNEKDWELMKSIIKENFFEFYPTMLAYESQHFICAYNMSIMRRNIFDEYCQFLFGVLTEIEKHYLKIYDRRDRYLGYLAENLTSIFYMHTKDKYKQVIAKLIPIVRQ